MPDAKWYANWVRMIPAETAPEKMRNLEAADLIESLAAELEQVKRERDAAVEEWKQSAIAGKSMCDTCMFSDDEGRCWNDCIDGELWQWRGVKED